MIIPQRDTHADMHNPGHVALLTGATQCRLDPRPGRTSGARGSVLVSENMAKFITILEFCPLMARTRSGGRRKKRSKVTKRFIVHKTKRKVCLINVIYTHSALDFFKRNYRLHRLIAG